MSEVEYAQEHDTDGPPDDETDAEEPQDDGTGEPEVQEEEELAQDDGAQEAVAQDVARIDAALSRASKNYGKKIAEIFGQDWMGWTPCPLCSEHAPGLLSPMPPSEEAIAAVRPLIGLPDLTTYVEDRFARKCDRCQGRGKTLTGSRVPEFATIRCADCNGAGFQSADPALTKGTNGVLEAPVLTPTHTDEVPPPAMPEASLVALEQMVAAARNAGLTPNTSVTS